MKAGFLEKLIERLGRIGPEDVQNYFLRLAQEKGFLETVFNAIQEGIIVTDSKARITYLNDAACGVFGLEAGEAIGKRLDERIRGLDWESLTRSSGPVSHDMEIFYPQNRFINFYVVPLVMEQREPTVAGGGLSAVALAKADRRARRLRWIRVESFRGWSHFRSRSSCSPLPHRRRAALPGSSKTPRAPSSPAFRSMPAVPYSSNKHAAS
jgi:PAS domain-containing protein